MKQNLKISMNRITVLRLPFFYNFLSKNSSSLKAVSQERTFFEKICKKQVIEFPSKNLIFQSNRYKTYDSNTVVNQTGSVSIFKRFKDAYKQHGKILVGCHFISSWGWVISFFFLAKA